MRLRLVSVSLWLIGAAAAPMSGQMLLEYVDSITSLPGRAMHGHADYSWTLQTAQGDTLSLERFKDKVLFINMWATWCVPCVAEMRSIAALRDSLSDTDIEFLLVSPERPHHVRHFLYRHGYDLRVLVEYERMPEAFGLEALPTTYIIDRDGRVVFKYRGATDWDTAAARELLWALSASNEE